MNRVLIKRIDIWSVARTLFPLGWLLFAVISFITYLFMQSIASGIAESLGDYSWWEEGTPTPRMGLGAGILFSVVGGLFSTILVTFASVLGAAIYNYLAKMGGGITVNLARYTVISEPLEPGEDLVPPPDRGAEPGGGSES